MIKVLALDPIHEDGLALLRDAPDVSLVHLADPSDAEITSHIGDAEVLLLRGRMLSPGQWQSARKLRLVSRHGVGCDNVDFQTMSRLGATVAVAADANFVSVAEHAFALMLAACRRLITADAAVRGGSWGCRDRLRAREVMGAQVLTVGYGRIGQAFAQRASAFGAHVLVHDPYLPDGVSLPAGMRRLAELDTAVAEADIISLHVPGTACLFGAGRLARCREGALLINTSRGGLVDETALPAALDAGRPAVYATDVLANEPPAAGSPLLQRSDVIFTPHSAAMTAEGTRRMAIGCAQNALDFLAGRLPARMTAFAPG